MPDQNDTNTTLPPVDPTVPAASQNVDTPTPIIPSEAMATPTDTNMLAPSPTVPPIAEPVAPTPSPVVPDPAVVNPSPNVDEPIQPADNNNIIPEVATKIGESHNILVALSSDPSVDELCSAIGLSLYLDRLGKRVTAIYSGATPNALEFLSPEETFEQSADTLQDFVIALNKEKADHLRYKLDGDYVKIFITPYRSRISGDDLEFSYGDYNVDLVLALDVANGVDLDAALREHGRIMHNATVVNITTGNPGKLGEIEWSDKTASSISEMIAELLYAAGGQNTIEKEEATAFLTGIVAATNRFATAGTTSRTMELASRLMESGANQQLISKNITSDMENEFFSPMMVSGRKTNDDDPTKLSISHGEEPIIEEGGEEAPATERESTLLDDLKAAEASLAASVSGVVTPEEKVEPLNLTNGSPTLNPEDALPNVVEPAANVAPEAEQTAEYMSTLPPEVTTNTEDMLRTAPEKTIAPPEDFVPEPLAEGTNKYGQMLEEALADSESAGEPVESAPTPIISQPAMEEIPAPTLPPSPEMAVPVNPAMSATPTAPTELEENGVPEINYMPPMPGDETLPPPPTPPIDFGVTSNPEPITPTEESIPPIPSPEPVAPEPAIPEPTAAEPTAPTLPAPQETPQVVPIPTPTPTPTSIPQPQDGSAAIPDPSAFKIPGM